jgi:hypothetical protein
MLDKSPLREHIVIEDKSSSGMSEVQILDQKLEEEEKLEKPRDLHHDRDQDNKKH